MEESIINFKIYPEILDANRVINIIEVKIGSR